jgi:hypothetical protein
MGVDTLDAAALDEGGADDAQFRPEPDIRGDDVCALLATEEGPSREFSPGQRLCAAVLVQAVADLRSRDDGVRRNALDWFGV